MEENNNLEMGLFGMDSDLELNLDASPEDIAGLAGEDTPPAPAAETEDTTPGETPGEDIEQFTEEGATPPEDVGEEEDPEGGGDDNTSPNLYSSFASELHNSGVLPTLDLDKLKIKDVDGLTTVIKGEIDAQAKQYIISKVGEEGFDALEKGVSLAQYQQHTDTVASLDAITDDSLAEDLDLAKRVILQDYVNQGLTEVSAKRVLQKAIDLGDEVVLADAKESIASLRVYEHNRIEQEKVLAQTRKQEALQHQEKIDNDLKNAIYSKQSYIEGMPVNKNIQDKVYKAITEVVGESPNGVMENQLMRDRRENPIEFDSKLYYLYEITDGFKDFSKITTKATSKVATDFERALRQTKFDDAGTPSFTIDKDSYDGLGTELVL